MKSKSGEKKSKTIKVSGARKNVTDKYVMGEPEDIVKSESKLIREYYANIFEKEKYVGRGNTIFRVLSPIEGFAKDARIEFRTSVEFKSFIHVAALADMHGISEFITDTMFKVALAVILEKYPDIFNGDAKEIYNHSMAEIVMEIGKTYYNPDFVKDSKIFTDVEKKLKERKSKKKHSEIKIKKHEPVSNKRKSNKNKS